MLTFLILPPVLQAVMHCYPEVKKAIGGSEVMFEYLDRKPEIPPEGHLAPENLQGHIEFKDVTFSYSGNKEMKTENSFMLKVCMVTWCPVHLIKECF